MLPFEGKRILITGGTGSLGKTLIRRVFTGEMGDPARVIVFSRDEAKQHFVDVPGQRIETARHLAVPFVPDSCLRRSPPQCMSVPRRAGWRTGCISRSPSEDELGHTERTSILGLSSPPA